MKLSTQAKAVLGIVAVAGAYRLYQLWKASGKLSYTPVALRMKRDRTNFSAHVDIDILNPTNTTIRIRGIKGNLNWNNRAISSFRTGAAEIKPGTTKMTIVFSLNNLGLIQALTQAITDKKWPVLKVDMITMMPLFSYPESFEIKTEDYLKNISGAIFK
jgi:hypothetical protein